VEYPCQDLRSILEEWCKDCYPGVFKKLDPHYANGKYVIQVFGRHNSLAMMAFKRRAETYLKGKCPATMTGGETIKDFESAPIEERKEAAYSIAHEIKIAALVACLCYRNRNAHVYEIGSALGFGICLLSHLLEEKRVHDPHGPVLLTAIERDANMIEEAKFCKQVLGQDLAMEGIEFICADASEMIPGAVQGNDIIYVSLAEPPIIELVADIARSKKVACVLSYSDYADTHVEEIHGTPVEKLFANSAHDIYPFKDLAWDTNITHVTGRSGVVALPLLCVHDWL